MANLWYTSSYIWRPCWFLIFDGRWEYFSILFEILTGENVGIDKKNKSLDSLIRKIFVFEWFHLISMLIRSITQNAMDKKFSIRQFPSPEHPCIAFPQKNLAVLDISRFTFCKVDYYQVHINVGYLCLLWNGLLFSTYQAHINVG